jgi:hypothetical protein
MKVYELAGLINAECMTPTVMLERDIISGYSCDMLSWVMAHAKRGAAWITVQTHINVIAVASLMDFACIIIPENIEMEQECVEKAIEENIPVYKSTLSAYRLCGLLIDAGIQ